MTIRDALNALPKLYKEYRKGLYCADKGPRFELGKLCSELEGSRDSNLALQCDVKAVQERVGTVQVKAADRKVAAAKLHGHIS